MGADFIQVKEIRLKYDSTERIIDMKSVETSRQELKEMAEKIADMMQFPNYSDNLKNITYAQQVIQMLDDLHSRGMKDAAEIMIETSVDDYGYLPSCKQAILSAIKRKPRVDA